MLGVLADLLDLAFQKLDTSSALDQGIVAYDVSEHSKDGKQIKYLGRLSLDLARKHSCLSWSKTDISIRPMCAKTLAYPEVRTLQSVCFLFFPMFQIDRGQSTHKMQPYDDPLDGVHRPGSVLVRTPWPSQKTRGACLQVDHVEKLFHGKRSHLGSLLKSPQLTKIFKAYRHRLGITRALGQRQPCRIQCLNNMDGDSWRG